VLLLCPSIFLFLLPEFLLIAVVAETVVATDHFAARFALPQFLLLFEEFVYSVGFDEFADCLFRLIL
jgi:hypothetical protein